MPEQQKAYLWYCAACNQTFPGGETSPEKCGKCGRKTNGGFGLPFAAYPETGRVDIVAKTFIAYEGDNEWVHSANKILAGHAEIGAQLQEFVDHGLRLTKRQAIQLAKKVTQKGRDSDSITEKHV